MSWYDLCENPQAIHSLFPDSPPLDRIDLHEAVLHRDGPVLRLRGDLDGFPETRPPRWHEEDNTVQLTLALWGVSSVTVQGWEPDLPGVFTLARAGADALDFEFRADGDGVVLRGSCRTARIEGLTAYCNERRSP